MKYEPENKKWDLCGQTDEVKLQLKVKLATKMHVHIELWHHHVLQRLRVYTFQ